MIRDGDAVVRAFASVGWGGADTGAGSRTTSTSPPAAAEPAGPSSDGLRFLDDWHDRSGGSSVTWRRWSRDPSREVRTKGLAWRTRPPHRFSLLPKRRSRPTRGVPLRRVSARGHRRRRARLPRRRRHRPGLGHLRTGRPRAADAERRRRAAPLRLEPLQLSCHGPDRSHLIVPASARRGSTSSNVADDPRRPTIEKVIEPEEIVRKTGLTRPHTVHCMPDDNVVISMLGDEDGDGAGRLRCSRREDFEVKGRWENGGEQPPLNYDFWYQPRKNVLVSSRVRRAERLRAGVRPRRRQGRAATATVSTSGTSKSRELEQTIDLGENGLIPLEVRWHHDPDGRRGLRRRRAVEHHVALVPRERRRGRPSRSSRSSRSSSRAGRSRVPGLITDLVLSMDDRFLYFSNWLHGDLRQYDVCDPQNPKLTGQLWLGGLLGKPSDSGRRPERRPADAPALLRRPPPVRDELALLDLGQPVLSRARVVAPEGRLRS